ncbi:hypothetical protein ACB092_02G003000 [Castanea dentata]
MDKELSPRQMISSYLCSRLFFPNFLKLLKESNTLTLTTSNRKIHKPFDHRSHPFRRLQNILGRNLLCLITFRIPQNQRHTIQKIASLIALTCQKGVLPIQHEDFIYV